MSGHPLRIRAIGFRWCRAATLIGGMLAPLVVASCASVPREVEPLAPGVYTFWGEASGTNQYRNRTERFTVPVNGTVELTSSGAVLVTSTHGSCSSGASPTARGLAVSCPGMSLVINRLGGTARIQVQEMREVQSGCTEFEVDRDGRPTGRCRVQGWREQSRVVRASVPLLVSGPAGH